MGREDARSDGHDRAAAARRQGQKGQAGRPPGVGFAETERSDSTVHLTESLSPATLPDGVGQRTPEEVAAQVAADFQARDPQVVARTVEGRAKASSDAQELAEAAKHPYASIRALVARNPATDDKTMVMLRADKDLRVRTWAMNPRQSEKAAEREIRRATPRSQRGTVRSKRPAPKNPFVLSLRRAFKNIFRF